MSEGIQLAALRELCNAGAVRELLAVAVRGGGFALKARYGLIERTLMAKRGQVRVFRSLDSLAELARFELGIGRLGVELADLQRRARGWPTAWGALSAFLSRSRRLLGLPPETDAGLPIVLGSWSKDLVLALNRVAPGR